MDQLDDLGLSSAGLQDGMDELRGRLEELEQLKRFDQPAALADAPMVHAGFPSPSTDYMKGVIDLNKELVRHPAATFYGRVVGDSMIDDGVSDGDVLVIDKSLELREGDMAVCFVDGEFCLKRVHIRPDGLWLHAANPRYAPIHIDEGVNFIMWGVVTYIIKKQRK